MKIILYVCALRVFVWRLNSLTISALKPYLIVSFLNVFQIHSSDINTCYFKLSYICLYVHNIDPIYVDGQFAERSKVLHSCIKEDFLFCISLLH